MKRTTLIRPPLFHFRKRKTAALIAMICSLYFNSFVFSSVYFTGSISISKPSFGYRILFRRIAILSPQQWFFYYSLGG
ncbi:hypothetical protein HMPREF1548_04027 [Clostridium sp. KLE 1755]|nr:hypothetical protein HMPREF1548_04027 [Clostridium sp. KLE 1755]